jgi:hypothetical protein
MAPSDEYIAIQGLRVFLQKYNAVLDFSLDRWQRVIFIIHTAIRLSDDDKATIKRLNKSKEAYAMMGYSVEEKGAHFVVKIPHSFKGKILMPFISSFLPLMEVSLF